MVFVLRVRTQSGMKRLVFRDDSATLDDLKLQLQDISGIATSQMTVSSTPPSRPTILSRGNASLEALKLRHGDMLYLMSASVATSGVIQGSQNATFSAAKSSSASTKTSKCVHGPRGRCLHCMPKETDANGAATTETKQATTPLHCSSHGPNAVCPNCIGKKPEDEDGEEMVPACNHPETVFCPKCIPKSDSKDDYRSHKCDCSSKNTKCIHCVQRERTLKTNFVPYSFFMSERRSKCSHPSGTTCGSCSDPPLLSYRGNPKCSRGHRPWPYGVCMKCAPPNVHTRLQKYRHTDVLSFHSVDIVTRFYKKWMEAPHQQKACILFGKFIKKPLKGFEDRKDVSTVIADVHAAYEPPQEFLPRGLRFQRDSKESVVRKVATALGLQTVGWMIATLPRSGAKYKGRVFMSGTEVRHAARFQETFKDDRGHSNFVTCIVEHSEHVEPSAYMVSDQCVALERDAILGSAADPNMLVQRKPKDGQLVPTFVYKDKSLEPGAEFLPDDFIVPVNVTTPVDQIKIIHHCEFPSQFANDRERNANITGFMHKYAHEDWHTKLSDLNLLVHLTDVISLKNVLQLADYIRKAKPLSAELRAVVDRGIKNIS